jgi:hypothetical protein
MSREWIIVEDGVDDEEAPVVWHLARLEDDAYRIVATFRYGKGDALEVLTLVDPEPAPWVGDRLPTTREFLERR